MSIHDSAEAPPMSYEERQLIIGVQSCVLPAWLETFIVSSRSALDRVP